MSRSSRADLPIVLTVAGTLSVLVATLLPWLRSGSAVRNAYALARSAEIIGIGEGWSRRACLALLYSLPLLVAATWTAAAAGRRRTTAMLGAAVGVISVAAGIIVTAQTAPELGPVVAIITGSLAVSVAAWLARSDGRAPMSTRGASDERA